MTRPVIAEFPALRARVEKLEATPAEALFHRAFHQGDGGFPDAM